MIVDTSVLVALLREEEGADQFLQAMDVEPVLRLSAGSLIELTAVMTRTMTQEAHLRADLLIRSLAITIEPVSVEQARIAQNAYREFGRGTGHLASLNFGDCFAYSLAKLTGEPLVYKGNDFGRTDLGQATWRS